MEAMPRYSPEEITYELFGIDPETFYSTKFALGRGMENALANPVYRHEIGFEKIRRLIESLAVLLPEGGIALDLGCGAGTYGPTLLANVPGLVLHGVDMSETCLEQARENGYQFTDRFELTKKLPYDDGFFDAVFSMDFLGHVEFRYKDAIIGETGRITKPGGGGHHGVETGFTDYFNCNPADESDPIRRFVYADGHIGTEPAQAVCDRFARHFGSVAHRITYLYPFLTVNIFQSLFGDGFKEAIDQFDQPQARWMADVVLGRLNAHFIEQYGRIFGEAFKANDGPPMSRSEAHEKAHSEMQVLIRGHNEKFGIDFVPVPRELFRPAGFSSITLVK
jgi:ubiquinone/menaquinone biosynthesis C-methylase UbiE